MEKLISIIKSKIENKDIYAAQFIIEKKTKALGPKEEILLITECVKLSRGNSLELYTFLVNRLGKLISEIDSTVVIENREEFKRKIVEIVKIHDISESELRAIQNLKLELIFTKDELKDLGIVKSVLRSQVESIFNGSIDLNVDGIKAMVYKNYFSLIKEVTYEDAMFIFITSLKNDKVLNYVDKEVKKKLVSYFEEYINELKDTCRNNKEMKTCFLNSIANIKTKYIPYEKVVALIGTLY